MVLKTQSISDKNNYFSLSNKILLKICQKKSLIKEDDIETILQKSTTRNVGNEGWEGCRYQKCFKMVFIIKIDILTRQNKKHRVC